MYRKLTEALEVTWVYLYINEHMEVIRVYLELPEHLEVIWDRTIIIRLYMNINNWTSGCHLSVSGTIWASGGPSRAPVTNWASVVHPNIFETKWLSWGHSSAPGRNCTFLKSIICRISINLRFVRTWNFSAVCGLLFRFHVNLLTKSQEAPAMSSVPSWHLDFPSRSNRRDVVSRCDLYKSHFGQP